MLSNMQVYFDCYAMFGYAFLSTLVKGNYTRMHAHTFYLPCTN